MSNSLTAWTVAYQATLSSTISQSCSNSCSLSQWFYPTISSSATPFSFCLQSLPASGPFPVSHLLASKWPKYWNFTITVSPSSEYSGLISFRIDWFDLLAVQGIVKSLLYCYNSKVSVLQHSAFFMVQLSFSNWWISISSPFIPLLDIYSAPSTGHLIWRADSLEKTLMLGRIEGRRRRGWQRMRWLDSITDSVGMSLGKLWEIENREAWHAEVHGVSTNGTWLGD